MTALNSTNLFNIACAFGLLLVGYFLARRISSLIERAMLSRFSRHHVMLISRGGFYLIFLIFFVSSLQHLGFNLSVLLGAAGVFTVAISFASQTAASNLISGIFLLFERPFKMGDSIEVNGISGVVESIDLLSTKLKTSDNKLVRIPNEKLIKSDITNVNFFDTRRIDILLNLSYQNDITVVQSLLLAIAKDCPQALQNPEPSVIINQFTDSALTLKFMIWANTAHVTPVKNHIQENIKRQFDKNGIEMPSTHMIIPQKN